MPINGIVVAISISDLLTADDAGMDWHVKVVRDRINELITNLGFVFPLYIVFTKCDLLSGFQSFFGDLNEASRNQVWGSYLDIKPGENPGDVVDRKFFATDDANYRLSHKFMISLRSTRRQRCA